MWPGKGALWLRATSYNLGRFSCVWVEGSSNEKIRGAMVEQASLFLNGGFVERLPEPKRTNGRRVLNYWVEQATTRVSTQDPQVVGSTATSQSSAVSALENLFAPAPVLQASQAS